MKRGKMTTWERATLLDMVPKKYRDASFAFKDNPEYELRPSKANPNVKRWHRRGAVLDSDEDGHVWKSNLHEHNGLGRALVASALLEEVAGDTSHKGAVKEWANTRVRVVRGFWRNLLLPTPKYFPDTNEIVVGEKHLSEKYAKRYGADGPGSVIAHELAHSWDFAVAKSKGHEQKSFWMSEIMPRIVKATGGNAPLWADLPEFKRFKYATLEATEMPAVLTELMLTRPEHYEAIDRWFKRHHKISIKDAMAEFWGTDVFNHNYHDEKEVARLLAKMDSYRHGSKREKWKSRIAREVSYSEGKGDSKKRHEPDPGFVKLSVLERQRSTELSPENGEGGNEENG